MVEQEIIDLIQEHIEKVDEAFWKGYNQIAKGIQKDVLDPFLKKYEDTGVTFDAGMGSMTSF